MTTALITHPDCERHAMPGHPERPERLRAVMERLHASGIADDMTGVMASEVSFDHISLVHPKKFIEAIEASERADQIVRIDPDTYMSPGSIRAARLAAGACVEATGRVLQGEFRNAFCAVRPPGHHAELAAAMGFCLYNNIAIAAMTALADPCIGRVAILDFDVHHCNGTVDIFKADERVLVCSSFQDHFYPHRYLDYTNPHIVNSPLAAGTGSTAFRHAIEQDWIPALAAHKPDFIFVSAGFDGHKQDPIGQLDLTEDDFRWITMLIADQARSLCGGRLVSTLEGGYDLTALSQCVAAHAEVLVSAGQAR